MSNPHYIIVSNRDISEVQAGVNNLLESGYILVGSMTFGNGIHFQSMIREGVDDIQKPKTPNRWANWRILPWNWFNKKHKTDAEMIQADRYLHERIFERRGIFDYASVKDNPISKPLKEGSTKSNTNTDPTGPLQADPPPPPKKGGERIQKISKELRGQVANSIVAILWLSSFIFC